MKDRTRPQTSENTEIQLVAGVANALRRDLNRRDFFDLVMPEVLSCLGQNAGGIVHQRDGQWHPEVWLGDQWEVPELLIGETLDAGKTAYAEGWCVAPLVHAADHGNAETLE